MLAGSDPSTNRGLPAVAVHETDQFFAGNARENGRVVDLVAVQIEDGQHGAVANGIEEFVAVPGGGQRPGFGLAVADHHGHDQIGIVEGGAKRMRDAVAELAAFVNRPRRFGRAVTADAAGKGKLHEEALQAAQVLAAIRVHVAVRTFEVHRPEHAGRAVARPGQIDDVDVVLANGAVEVGVDEAERGTRAPVAKQALLHMLGRERLAQQRIVAQIDHAGRKVVACAPEAIDARQCLRRKRRSTDGGFRRSEGARSDQLVLVCHDFLCLVGAARMITAVSRPWRHRFAHRRLPPS